MVVSNTTLAKMVGRKVTTRPKHFKYVEEEEEE